MSTINGRRRSRAAQGVLALALAMVLGACGPGVGGTGTGDTAGALDHFGASAASLCQSDLAPLASCRQDGGTATPVPGADPVYLADTPTGARLLVRLQDDVIEVVDTCTPLKFRGQWGIVAGQDGRFYGNTDPDGVPAPATLDAQASGTTVLLTVRDGEGRVLLGPLAVTVMAGSPEALACD